MYLEYHLSSEKNLMHKGEITSVLKPIKRVLWCVMGKKAKPYVAT